MFPSVVVCSCSERYTAPEERRRRPVARPGAFWQALREPWLRALATSPDYFLGAGVGNVTLPLLPASLTAVCTNDANMDASVKPPE